MLKFNNLPTKYFRLHNFQHKISRCFDFLKLPLFFFMYYVKPVLCSMMFHFPIRSLERSFDQGFKRTR